MSCKPSSFYSRLLPTILHGFLTPILRPDTSIPVPATLVHISINGFRLCGRLSCCTLVSVMSRGQPMTGASRLTSDLHTGFRAFASFRYDSLLVLISHPPVPKHQSTHIVSIFFPVSHPTNRSTPGLSRHWYTYLHGPRSKAPFHNPLLASPPTTLFVRRALSPVQPLSFSEYGLGLISLLIHSHSVPALWPPGFVYSDEVVSLRTLVLR